MFISLLFSETTAKMTGKKGMSRMPGMLNIKQRGHRPKAAANGTKDCAVSQIINVNVPRDKFMLCLGGFLLVAVCLASYGIVLASRMEMNSPIDVKNADQRIIKGDTF